jgi:serine/threonine-protein kinase
VYTGREAYRADTVAQLKDLRRSSVLSTPSSIITDIDPAVERVIMRCLENDPADRPGSAIAVAAALPGGDPLAMALAAGETPSPEMLVQAGERGGLRPAVAFSLGAALLVLLLVSVLARDQVRVERFTNMDLPPAVLAHRAGEIAVSLGYTDRPVDTHEQLSLHWSAINWIKEHDAEPGRWQRAVDLQIGLVQFWWRSARGKMTPQDWSGGLSWNDPPHMQAGMIRMILDPAGRLEMFDAVPERWPDDDGDGEDSPHGEMDWAALLAATGLPLSELEPTEPTRTPPHAFDARAAWRWTGPGSETCPLQIEAAAWRGRPVWMDGIRPWDEPADDDASARSGPPPVLMWFLLVLILCPFAGAVVLAARNIRAGRGDRRGAFRLALFFLVVSMIQWLFLTDRWISTSGFPLAVWALAFGRAASIAVMVWLFYLAIEPFARRYWPRTIVSWTRLLAGRWRDPLVGRDILIGAVAGCVFLLILPGEQASRGWLGQPLPQPTYGWATASLGGRHAIGTVFQCVTGTTPFIGFFVLLFLARLVLRRTWLAVVAILIAASIFFISFADDALSAAAGVSVPVIVILVAVRFGLLAVASIALVAPLIVTYPTTLDMSTWYASVGLVGPFVLLALAGFGLWTSLAGQPLFKDDV